MARVCSSGLSIAQDAYNMSNPFIHEALASHSVKVYVAGDLAPIRQVCRQVCYEEGLCVTVEPVSFIYTGGEETGAVVGFVNYPRFPSTPSQIDKTAIRLAERLVTEACQRTALVVTPTDTIWIRRETKAEVVK